MVQNGIHDTPRTKIHECFLCDQITSFFKKQPDWSSAVVVTRIQDPANVAASGMQHSKTECPMHLAEACQSNASCHYLFLLEKSDWCVAKPTMHSLQVWSVVFQVRRMMLQSLPHECCKDDRHWPKVDRMSLWGQLVLLQMVCVYKAN